MHDSVVLHKLPCALHNRAAVTTPGDEFLHILYLSTIPALLLLPSLTIPQMADNPHTHGSTFSKIMIAFQRLGSGNWQSALRTPSGRLPTAVCVTPIDSISCRSVDCTSGCSVWEWMFGTTAGGQRAAPWEFHTIFLTAIKRFGFLVTRKNCSWARASGLGNNTHGCHTNPAPKRWLPCDAQ